MDLRPGYKRTELGVIPEDWDTLTLGDKATKVGSGITPTGGANVYMASGRAFVRSQNVGWGGLLLEDLAYIDEDTHSSFASTEILVHDVLLNITGASIGRCSIADERIASGNVNQHVCIIRTIADELHPDLLKYLLLSKLGQKQIDSFQAGGNRQGLNFAQIRSISLVSPQSLPEQRAIATALGDMDALLLGLDRLIAKKRDLKQAAMQQLLTGQTRLPGFSGEWEEKRLEEIGESLIGLTYSPADVREHGTLVLRSSNVQNGALAFHDNVFVSMDIPDRALVQTGDVLICARNGSRDLIGKSALLDERTEGMAFGAFMAVFRSPIGKLINFLFQSEILKRQINEHLGATINQITNKSLNSFRVPLAPTKLEQIAIASVLSDMDADLTALETRRDKTRALKQAMMQELLTGNTRLPLAEPADV